MKSYRSIPECVLLVLGVLGVVGCASAPRLQSMIPRDESLVFASSGATLSVGRVEGGHETDAMGVSKINAHDLRLALIEAVHHSHLFTEVVSDSKADYELSAIILLQDQPGIGLAMTVDLAVKYVLTNKETGEEVFNDRIASSYTAGMGEAFVGVTRVRKANEGAVRENIKKFLNEIAELLIETR